MTKIGRRGTVLGGSGPVLMVGYGVKVGIARMAKLGISKSVIGLTNGW
jgi:hypothetical protein